MGMENHEEIRLTPLDMNQLVSEKITREKEGLEVLKETLITRKSKLTPTSDPQLDAEVRKDFNDYMGILTRSENNRILNAQDSVTLDKLFKKYLQK